MAAWSIIAIFTSRVYSYTLLTLANYLGLFRRSLWCRYRPTVNFDL